MKKLLNDESGQVVIFTVLCMTVLLGLVAFAADVGTLLYAKRTIQSAADSAAIAGAAEINYYTIDKTTVAASAQKSAKSNGFTNGSGGTTVTVNYLPGPATGPYAGNQAYVEVIIKQTQPTFFMKLFSTFSMDVSARAVAGLGAVNSGCFFVLGPTNPPGNYAMDLQGNFTVNAPSCGVLINSNDPNALHFTGAKGTLLAGSVGVVGGDSGQTGDSTPAPVTGIAPTSDPLGFITPPNPLTLSCTAPPGGTLTGTIGPSTFGTVCYSGNVTLNNVVLNSATYVFTGNVVLTGTVTTGAGGATLDINSGSLTELTNAALDLTAPTATTDPYHGIAIMEPATNTNTLAFAIGTATGSITGIIYAPSAQMTMQDAGGNKKGALSLNTDLIVGSFADTSALLNMTSYSQSNPTTSLLKVPTLVE